LWASHAISGSKRKKLIGLWAIGAILEFNTKNMYPYEEEE
jgi:hypothetical protein